MLEFILVAVNDFTSPVQVRKKKNSIRLSWNCDDPVWCQRMLLAGLQKQYELHLEFSAATKTVIMRDRVRHVNLARCPLKVTSSVLSSARFYCRIRTEQEWRLSFLEQTAPSDYQFHPQEIKSSVFNTIIENGWNVRFDL
jgi:hypothetical protein